MQGSWSKELAGPEFNLWAIYTGRHHLYAYIYRSSGQLTVQSMQSFWLKPQYFQASRACLLRISSRMSYTTLDVYIFYRNGHRTTQNCISNTEANTPMTSSNSSMGIPPLRSKMVATWRCFQHHFTNQNCKSLETKLKGNCKHSQCSR